MGNIDKPWWVKELESIFSASRGSQITDDMKRSANIALKIVRGEKWDDEAQAWIPGPPSWEVAAPQVVAEERKLPPLPQYFPDIVNIRADEELRAQDYATQYARAALQAAPVQPVAVPDDWKWMPIKATGTMADAGAFSGLPVGAAEPWIAKQVWEAMAAQSPAAPAAQGDAKDAERYRWLRDKSEPGICAFYLSVGKAFDGVKFNQVTVDEAIDAQIAAIAAKAAS